MKELTAGQREHWKNVDKQNYLMAEARLEESLNEIKRVADFLAIQKQKLNCNHPGPPVCRVGGGGMPTCRFCGSNPRFGCGVYLLKEKA